ncbi:RNA-directed DNA polymerase [Candidatus Magnetomoraceae bacterium gMMP-15]
MKRYGNLFKSISSFSNLFEASRKARLGKRYKSSIAAFEFNLENELLKLNAELLEQTYKPQGYYEFHIYDPKPRKISVALYRDRVVHNALCQIIEPIFDRSMIYDTYACRRKKGVHKAVDRFTKFSRKFKYVLKCDVKLYFPSIDHEILKTKIRRKIKCKKTLRLIDAIIDASNPQFKANFYFPGDTLFTPYERPKGIPIGNLTSQLFANLYLNDADHFIKEKFSHFPYLRYMDDMVLFGNDKSELWDVLKCLETFLEKDRLLLKAEKSMLYPVHVGVDYLGYKVFPDHRLVRYKNVIRYKRKLKKLQQMYNTGKINLNDVRSSVQSWIGHVQHADSWRLRESIFESIILNRGRT